MAGRKKELGTIVATVYSNFNIYGYVEACY